MDIKLHYNTTIYENGWIEFLFDVSSKEYLRWNWKNGLIDRRRLSSWQNIEIETPIEMYNYANENNKYSFLYISDKEISINDAGYYLWKR